MISVYKIKNKTTKAVISKSPSRWAYLLPIGYSTNSLTEIRKIPNSVYDEITYDFDQYRAIISEFSAGCKLRGCAVYFCSVLERYRDQAFPLHIRMPIRNMLACGDEH